MLTLLAHLSSISSNLPDSPNDAAKNPTSPAINRTIDNVVTIQVKKRGRRRSRRAGEGGVAVTLQG
ncbi:hypothetical protein [Nonomuraea zeae]|uniref:Uncharacterized protein n=1 Tax=Nonomuraea zeae TaxID=1642303 RepID=A0A5S4EYM6_9ACTN|nr:hypothetical protein [Nonomuraea zeae]TMR08632.1 hypothetical protein ETD85_62100 [Nonomuraea zeae]